MSWAARRRLMYVSGVILFFVIVIGGPVAWHIATIPPTCHDGREDGGETAVDEGGPCLILNPAQLQAEGVLWTRTFEVRPGTFDAVAYVDNPNQDAGVLAAPYELDIYDDQNVLVADVPGTAFIMPDGVTPIFIGGIDTGNRDAFSAQFKFTAPLTWERVVDESQAIQVGNEQVSSAASSSQIAALATNTSISPIGSVTFVATVFDSSGNAIASSQTALQGLGAGQSEQIYFTWPSEFSAQVGRVDIIPVIAPEPDPSAKR